MEDEAFLSDGSDSAIELLDSEEDEPHSEEAYVASDVTDDGEDEDLPAGGDEDLASQDDETMDSLGVAAVVSLPVPVAPAPLPKKAFPKKAAVVKRSACHKRRDPIPFKYKRRLVSLFGKEFPGPFEDEKAVKVAVAGKPAGKRIMRVLQEALHKMSEGRSKLHNFGQFVPWLWKDLRGKRTSTKRKNIKGLHQDIEAQTFSYYQGVVSGGKRCTKLMLEEYAEKALRKKLDNATAKFGHSWTGRFMKRFGIRERVVKRQVFCVDPSLSLWMSERRVRTDAYRT